MISRVTLLAWLSLGVLGGLWLAQYLPAAFSFWWLLLAPSLPLLYCGKKWAIPILGGIGMMIGLWHGGSAALDVRQYQRIIGTKIEMTGVIASDPMYDKQGRRDFYIQKVVVAGRKLPGQVRVRTFGIAPVTRGDTIMASGKLYPGFGNYQATMPYAEVRILVKDMGPMAQLRRYFLASVYSVLPEPQASLGLGFLIGLKSQLPGELHEQLRALALTHIVVASGFNLTVWLRLSRRLLGRWSKFQALAGSIALMVIMLAMTGGSPSIARAAVVTSLALAAWYYGRYVHPLLLILGAAAITAMANPLSFWTDLGWWLSFAAFAGVLLLAPLLTRLWCGREPPGLLRQTIIETCAAQLVAEPIIMMSFGQFALLGLLANVLVVPFIPLAMLATFVAGAIGMVLPVLAAWVAFPAQWILGYIVMIITWLGHIPGVSVRIGIGLLGVIIILGIVAGLGMGLYKRFNFSYRHQPSIVE